MKFKSHHLLLASLVFSMLFIVFSCSDNSTDEDNNNNNNNNYTNDIVKDSTTGNKLSDTKTTDTTTDDKTTDTTTTDTTTTDDKTADTDTANNENVIPTSTDNTFITAITNNSNPMNDNFFSLSPAEQQAHWLNPKNLCSVGWDIYPYRRCGLSGNEAKNYKNTSFATCGVESEIHECKSCRSSSFGIESYSTKKVENVTRNYPFTFKIVDINDPKDKIFHRNRHPGNSSLYVYMVRRDYDRKLPNISTDCSQHVSDLTKEYQKQYPGKTVTLRFSQGNYKLSDSNSVVDNGSLFWRRLGACNSVLGFYITDQEYKDRMYDIEKNRWNYVPMYAECNYTLEVKEPVYKEMKNCEVCGSIDEVQFKPCIQCGINETTVVRATKTLSKQQVEQTEGKVLQCKTCDDITFDLMNINDISTKENIVRKIMCLKDNLKDLTEEDVLTKSYITLELERLRTYSVIE